jgi:CheY-like chemotaxis protein
MSGVARARSGAEEERSAAEARQAVEEARRALARWAEDTQTILARVSRVLDEHEALQDALQVSRDDGLQLRERVAALEADNAACRAQLGHLQATHVDLAGLVVEGLQGVLSQVMPQVPGGDTESPAAPAGPAPAAAEPPTRILLVDDEPHFPDLIAEFLLGRDFDVRIASSGEEAVEVVQEFAPRIVLLDLMMPGIGGMEALRQIKALRPDTSVIMATAIDDRDTARRALALGASDYVVKPLSLDFLESLLAVHAQGVLPVSLPAPSPDGPPPSVFARR